MTRAARLLFSVVTAVSFFTLSAAGQAPAKPLTVEAIFAHGPLIGEQPEELRWSPDGKHLTYRQNGEVMEVDLGSNPEQIRPHVLVDRAKLASFTGVSASEIDRDHRDRYKMASYLWARDSAHLLFDANGGLWLYDLRDGSSVQIGLTGAASGNDPKFSPDGKSVSFIRDHGLAVVRLNESGAPATQVAPAPNPATLNGQVDWIYLEELEVRSNYFWSPDSSRLAYLQMNEAGVPEYPLTDWIPTHATVEMQRYPQPGDPNPDVRVGVVSAQGGKTAWVKLPIRAGQDTIPRFGWADEKTVWIETLTRDQKHRALYFADAAPGSKLSRAHLALELDDEKFFDNKYDIFVESGKILLTSWADGHTHLYLYSYDAADPANATARLERQLTKGNFEVDDILRVDFTRQLVDYASNEHGGLKDGELDQQLWEVNFNGERKPLKVGDGTLSRSFAPSRKTFVDRQSTRMEPPTLRLCAEAEKCSVLWTAAQSLEPYQLRTPVQLEVKAHDGTTLYATLLLPEGKDMASVPLIVNPYGGPGSAAVVNKWNDALLFDELLAQHGFAVLHADNRGMSGRSRAFAQAAYHDFGAVQLEDQLTVVDAALAAYPQLDPQRMGWWGWSWGGTFTLYTLSHSDRFRAGVAVAPVTDWRNYDSIYTERYMSDPAEFAAGYRDFSVVNSAASLKGRLLLVHGTDDDNVHMENSVQFVQKLIAAGIPYDLEIYPRKTHSISGAEARTHLYNSILAHFEQYLKPPVKAEAIQ